MCFVRVEVVVPVVFEEAELISDAREAEERKDGRCVKEEEERGWVAAVVVAEEFLIGEVMLAPLEFA
jgi:hypothetical protein